MSQEGLLGHIVKVVVIGEGFISLTSCNINKRACYVDIKVDNVNETKEENKNVDV